MNRLNSMARFEGLGKEPKVAAKCSGPYCNSPIYVGQEFIKLEESNFCGTSCMLDSLDYEWVGGEEQ